MLQRLELSEPGDYPRANAPAPASLFTKPLDPGRAPIVQAHAQSKQHGRTIRRRRRAANLCGVEQAIRGAARRSVL